jgi:hypothetical protein
VYPAGNPTAATGSLPPGIPGLPVGTTLAPTAATGTTRPATVEDSSTFPAGPLGDLYKLTAEGEQVVNEVDNSVKNTILDLRWIKASVARLKAQGAVSSAEEYLKKVVGSDTEDFKTKVEENLKLVEELVGKGEKTLGMAQADMKESKDGIQKAEEVMAAQKALKTATASLGNVPREDNFKNSDPKA